ncbi:MAG: sugar transferase [Candidatus Berkelbacteria bacterium]|nr:MAG: sugar transferase [Candidatus Berkelbacteria bacterium]QQG52065.1 MAG: sugar transferase [Candidatus Berkelbacteria bacterium]
MRKFNLQFALVTVIIDLLMLWLAMAVAYQIRSNGEELYLWSLSYYSLFVLKFLPVWLVLFIYQGLYRLRTPIKGWTAIARTTTAILSGWGVILIYLYLSRSPEALVFPRLIIAYGLGLTLLFVFIGRFLLDGFRRLLNSQGYGLIRAAVIAKDEQVDFIKTLSQPTHGRVIQGVITADYLEALRGLVQNKKIDELIVALPGLDEKTILSLVDWAETNYVNFVQVQTLLSVKATNIETGSLAGTPVIFYKQSPLDGWGRIFKRAFDLVLVIPLLIIISPLYFLLALLVKLSSPGPVYYKEKRVGQDGQEFVVGKFRSMYADWRERFPNVQDWSADEATDVRITPLGRVLRKTNLDELPQLWDVLTGRMSIVGPRPEQPKYVEKFAQEIPAYVKRHHVKSGLTGWAQINGLRGNTPIPDRVKYDLYYIENWSIWFDLRIILGTVVYIFRQFVTSS